MDLSPPETGLGALLRDERQALRRFLAARTGSEDEADDLLSELWIRAESAPVHDITNPRAYLFRMANNLVLDRLREARRRERRDAHWSHEHYGIEPGAEAVSTAEAEARLLESERAMLLAAAIAALPRGAQRVLRMHKIEGLCHGEIAGRLGISRSAVEKHMAVAMTHLRRSLEELR